MLCLLMPKCFGWVYSTLTKSLFKLMGFGKPPFAFSWKNAVLYRSHLACWTLVVVVKSENRTVTFYIINNICNITHNFNDITQDIKLYMAKICTYLNSLLLLEKQMFWSSKELLIISNLKYTWGQIIFLSPCWSISVPTYYNLLNTICKISVTITSATIYSGMPKS